MKSKHRKLDFERGMYIAFRVINYITLKTLLDNTSSQLLVQDQPFYTFIFNTIY